MTHCNLIQTHSRIQLKKLKATIKHEVTTNIPWKDIAVKIMTVVLGYLKSFLNVLI